MNTETGTSKRKFLWQALVIAVLLLAVIPPLIPRGNPYASMIEDIAIASDWNTDNVQMVNGTITDISFLRWTRVEIVVRTATSEQPVYATVRKGPFSQAHVSCYSVGSPQPCAG